MIACFTFFAISATIQLNAETNEVEYAATKEKTEYFYGSRDP